MRAYDLTDDRRHLENAKSIADWMWSKGWDNNVCGGGPWWRQEPPLLLPVRDMKKIKLAIANEPFFKLAAPLHNRIRGNKAYMDYAKTVWSWFRQSDLLKKASPLVSDGLYDSEKNPDKCEGYWLFTYSQGVLLGALTELHRATGDRQMLVVAEQIANAAINVNSPPDRTFVFTAGHPLAGVLRELCEQSAEGCVKCKSDKAPCETIDIDPTDDDDIGMFKGVFVRNLRELYDHNRALGRSRFNWASLFKRQTASLEANARSGWAEFGFRWTGPRGLASIGTANDSHYGMQSIAVDAFNAASGL